MTHIIKTHSTPYSAEQLFDLVADFERYPTFLPFCTHASTQRISDDQVNGTLFVSKGPFKKAFTTQNTMQRHSNPPQILIHLVNGPFKTLDGHWQFIDHQHGSDVKLDLNFEMAASLLHYPLSSAFSWIAEAMVEAFCQQADSVYGSATDRN